MGLFSNPLGYAGYPPGAGAPATVVNSTVRAATAAEAATGTLTDCYISPATADSATALDFASPPALGFGSTTARPVHATTLGSSGDTNLATGGGAKIGFFGATAITQPANTTDLRTLLINLGLLATGGASPLNLNGGALTVGSQTIVDGGNVAVGSTNGSQIGTAPTQKLGFFGATPIVQGANTTDLRTLLINMGFLATGGASPLNLNGGTLTAGSAAITTSGATTGVASNTAAGSGVAGIFTSSAATVDAVQCVTGSIKVPATTISGASPQINNVRTGQVSFSDVIANGAYGTLTITNSFVDASSVIIAAASCTTVNSAVQIVEITPSPGSVAFRLFNAGAAATAANVNINFWVLN